MILMVAIAIVYSQYIVDAVWFWKNIENIVRTIRLIIYQQCILDMTQRPSLWELFIIHDKKIYTGLPVY